MHAQKFFSDLLGGVSVDEFTASIQDRRHHHARGAFPAADTLISLKDVDHMLGSPATSPAEVDVIVDGRLRHTDEVVSAPGGVNAAHISDMYDSGASVRLSNVHRRLESCRRLARRLSAALQAEVGANVYLTPPGQPGFEPHFDDHDIYVVQVNGTKHWDIFDSYTDAVALPRRGEVFDARRHRPGRLADRLTLRAGDVLYVPRGVMHAARAGADGSLHVTFSVPPLTWGALLRRALEHAEFTERHLRCAVPIDLLHSAGPGELPDVSKEAVRASHVAAALEEYRVGCSAYVAPPEVAWFASECDAADAVALRLLPDPVYHLEALAPGVFRLHHAGRQADLDEAGQLLLAELCEVGEVSMRGLIERHGARWAMTMAELLRHCGLVAFVPGAQ